jgi:hypothetical protein
MAKENLMRPSTLFLLGLLLPACGDSTGDVISPVDGGSGALFDAQPVNCASGPNYTGCPCTLGEIQSCYTGPAGTEGVGFCSAGTQACNASGELGNAFGPCTGQITPSSDGSCTEASTEAGIATCPSNANPPTTPQTLVMPAGDQVVALGVFGCSVYYTLLGEGVYSIPSSGGTATNLVPNPIPGVDAGDGTFGNAPLVSDGTSVYFAYLADSAAMLTDVAFGVPLAGGAPRVMGSMGWSSDIQIVSIAADRDDVYWSAQGDGTIFRAPITGGSPMAVVSDLSLPRGAPGAIALGGATLYVSDPAGDLLAVPTSGGSPTTLYAGPPITSGSANISGAGASGLAVDDTNVYFTYCPFGSSGSATPALMRIPRAGGSPTVLASSCATGIAVDAQNVYWIGTEDGGTLEEVPITGGPVRVLATGQFAAVGPVIDDTSIYWGTAQQTGTCGVCPPITHPGVNAVWRLAK